MQRKAIYLTFQSGIGLEHPVQIPLGIVLGRIERSGVVSQSSNDHGGLRVHSVDCRSGGAVERTVLGRVDPERRHVLLVPDLID
jgi:hypothetical protein